MRIAGSCDEGWPPAALGAADAASDTQCQLGLAPETEKSLRGKRVTEKEAGGCGSPFLPPSPQSSDGGLRSPMCTLPKVL